MASARLVLAVLVLMVAAVTLTEGIRGFGPKRCCTRFNEKPVRQEKVVSYTRTSQQCNNPAILLKMVGGHNMCARPSAVWVRNLMRYLDNKTVLVGETSNL